MRKNLMKLYSNLTAEERFKLALEALSRGDKNEFERLSKSCPKKVYRMNDAAFTDLMDASVRTATTFTIIWLETYMRYRIIETALKEYLTFMEIVSKSYITGANNAWKHAGKKKPLFDVEGRQPTDEELKEIGLAAAVEHFPKELQDCYCQVVSELKAVYQAFTRFCKTVQLKPEKLLAWYQPIMRYVEEAKTLLEGDIPADKEIEEDLYMAFCDHWPGL